MIQLEPVAEATGRELTSGVAREPEGFRDRSAKKGIAERIQDHSERAFRNVPLLMSPSTAVKPIVEAMLRPL